MVILPIRQWHLTCFKKEDKLTKKKRFFSSSFRWPFRQFIFKMKQHELKKNERKNIYSSFKWRNDSPKPASFLMVKMSFLFFCRSKHRFFLLVGQMVNFIYSSVTIFLTFKDYCIVCQNITIYLSVRVFEFT